MQDGKRKQDGKVAMQGRGGMAHKCQKMWRCGAGRAVRTRLGRAPQAHLFEGFTDGYFLICKLSLFLLSSRPHAA